MSSHYFLGRDAFDRLSAGFAHPSNDGKCLFLSPTKLVKLPLVWPILNPRNEPGTHRISDNVFPLLIVTFAAT